MLFCGFSSAENVFFFERFQRQKEIFESLKTKFDQSSELITEEVVRLKGEFVLIVGTSGQTQTRGQSVLIKCGLKSKHCVHWSISNVKFSIYKMSAQDINHMRLDFTQN